MANITVLNTSANLSSKTLLAAENANTVTGLLTFDRDPSAPFAVSASSAVVTNLDADKLDGQDAPTGTIVGTSDSQTLTNKTIALGSNTLSGTTAQFNTALSDDNFAVLGAVNTFTAFGSHTWSAGANSANVIHVENTTSNTTALARLQATAGTTAGFLDSYSQGYTTGSYDVQSATALVAQGSGGLSIAASHASGPIRFYAGGTTNWMTLSAAGLLTVTGVGTHTIGGGGTSVSSTVVFNGGNGTGIGAALRLDKNGNNGTRSIYIGHDSYLRGSGTSSDLMAYAGEGIKFCTGDTVNAKFGITSTGNWTRGASGNIMHSVGTPTIASGAGSSPSIAGNDYGFKVTIGTSVGPTDELLINFGNTWSTAPVIACLVKTSVGAGGEVVITTNSTTQVGLKKTAGWSDGEVVHVHAIGY